MSSVKTTPIVISFKVYFIFTLTNNTLENYYMFLLFYRTIHEN